MNYYWILMSVIYQLRASWTTQIQPPGHPSPIGRSADRSPGSLAIFRNLGTLGGACRNRTAGWTGLRTLQATGVFFPRGIAGRLKRTGIPCIVLEDGMPDERLGGRTR